MPRIHVCSLARLHATVVETGASHVATLISAATEVVRPESVHPDNHLFLGFHDIIDPQEGMTPPAKTHVESLIAFVRGWDRKQPLVIHGFAGARRSTAGAFIALAALDPDRDEFELADEIRRRSPSATPNIRMVRFADEILQRDGRMVAAIERIGRGRDAYEGDPFHFVVG
jgi:predicted protein tyrosine phosphatase